MSGRRVGWRFAGFNPDIVAGLRDFHKHSTVAGNDRPGPFVLENGVQEVTGEFHSLKYFFGLFEIDDEIMRRIPVNKAFYSVRLWVVDIHLDIFEFPV